MQGVVLVFVLLLNRRAWILALAAFAGGLWYEVFVHVVKPTTADTKPDPSGDRASWIHQLSERTPHLHHNQHCRLDVVRRP
jgi:hypothetical protein